MEIGNEVKHSSTITVEVSQILINKARFRKDNGDLTLLRNSIERVGRLIHPIIVDFAYKNNESSVPYYDLIAGCRRLACIKDLKWTNVEVTIWHDLSDREKVIVELEENIGRKDMTWEEEGLAFEEITRLKKEELEGDSERRGRGKVGERLWTLKDTADLAGVSTSDVSQKIKLVRALKENPQIKSMGLKQALSYLKRNEILKYRKELSRRLGLETIDNLILGDCEIELKKIKSESVGLVITDPPYGTELFEMFSSSFTRSPFDDSREAAEVILRIRDDLYRVLIPGSHMYIFPGFTMFREVRDFYSEVFQVRSLPLIWNKNYRGYCPDENHMWARNYEVILFCSKGTRAFNLNGKLKPSEGDIITDTKVPSSNKIHDTEKPVTLIEKFVLLSSDENQIVLDPFGGSGSTGKACIRNNRKFILIEKEEKTFSLMKEEIIEATRKHEEETIFPIIEAEDEEEEENEEGDVNIENGLDRRDTIREDEFSSS